MFRESFPETLIQITTKHILVPCPPQAAGACAGALLAVLMLSAPLAAKAEVNPEYPDGNPVPWLSWLYGLEAALCGNNACSFLGSRSLGLDIELASLSEREALVFCCSLAAPGFMD